MSGKAVFVEIVLYLRTEARNQIADKLIEAALIRLDTDDIGPLCGLFPVGRIKKIMAATMVMQGDYYCSPNRFFAGTISASVIPTAT